MGLRGFGGAPEPPPTEPPPVPPPLLPPGFMRWMMPRSERTRSKDSSAPASSRAFWNALGSVCFPARSMMNSERVLSAMPMWFSSSVVTLFTSERCASLFSAAIVQSTPPPPAPSKVGGRTKPCEIFPSQRAAGARWKNS